MPHPAAPGSSRRPSLRLILSSLLAVASLNGCGESDPGAPCEAGTFGTGGDDCAACDAGTYCPEGSEAPVDCEASGEWDDDGDPATECAALSECSAGEWESAAPTATSDRGCSEFSVCPPGEYVSAEGTETSDRVCAGCASGSYSVAEDSPSCEAWTACVAGEYVSTPGSATSDQACDECATGTYTDGPNQSACVPHGACAPGTTQTAPGDETSPPTCEACSAGEYCAGDTAPATPCGDGDGTWDHDGDPATACVARTECAAGTYVSDEGDAVTDRSCTTCAEGEYAETTNAPECAAWTACAPGEYVSASGSAASDQVCDECEAGEFSDAENAPSCTPFTVCAPTGEAFPGSSTYDRTCEPDEWVRQFGSSANDYAQEVGLDADGNVFVAGYTQGTLPGETSAGATDAFVRKYDGDGDVLWTRQFGSSAFDVAWSVSVDAVGNVFVAGSARGTLPGVTSAEVLGSYLRKYDGDGNVLWTRQFGSSANDSALAVSVDADGNVFVAGGEYVEEIAYAYVRKYDGDGNELWARRFGSASGDWANSVSVDGGGSVFVAGYTLGALPGETSAGNVDAFVRKYDGDGSELWTRQFGTPGQDWLRSASADEDGNVVVAGETEGALPGQTSAGNVDAFVRRYDGDGNELWTRQFGAGWHTDIDSVSAGGDGDVLVTGAVSGTLPGESWIGGIFVRRYASDGALLGTRQFGESISALSVSEDADGRLLVAGMTLDTLPGQTSAGIRDAFVVKLASP